MFFIIKIADNETLMMRNGAMVSLDIDNLASLSIIAQAFELDEKTIINDYFGQEFFDREIKTISEQETLKRFESILKLSEKIAKTRMASGDLDILRAVNAIQNNYPKLEVDVIQRCVVVGLEAKDIVFKRLFKLKTELFQIEGDIERGIGIVEQFESKLKKVSRD
jgi:hypothetical protein